MAIGDIRDERDAVVHLLVRVSDPVRLPALTQMTVKTRFKPAVSEDTVVLVEPTGDLLEKHGVCLAKGLVPLSPGICDGQLIMANTTDHDIWLRHQMTVGKAVYAADCEIHDMEDEDKVEHRLESIQHVMGGGVMNPLTLHGILDPI